MNDRVKTLLVYGNGISWKQVLADTTLRGVLGLEDERTVPARLLRHPLIRRAVRSQYETLSYMHDWPEAFCAAPELDVELCNISNWVEYLRRLRQIGRYGLIVILHSATVNSASVSLLLRTAARFQRRRGKLLIFLGNEYELLPIKIEFIRAVDADYIASQLPLDAARWLYAPCERSEVLPAPHALNPKLFYPDLTSRRPIDIGFVGDLYPYFVGDIERSEMIRFFQEHGAELGLTCDIRTQRLPRSAWSSFLNGCKGIIGAESGTYYLERTDATMLAVQAYLKAHPGAPFEEVHERFFKEYPQPVSGKAISSRHFEPIGTQTCQILLEGRYNDILVADEHYIALKKDFTNIRDVVARFKDEEYRTAMVTRTYEYALAGHTYQHRVASLLDAIFAN